MPANYDAIINKLAEDPEFLDLNPDEQDQLVNELAQERLGIIPKSENFLQKAIKNAQGFSRGFANVSTLGGTNLAEDAADELTGMLPFSQDVKNKSLDKTNEITRPNAPVGEFVGGSLPIGRGVQQIGKMGINALFGKQLAKRALPKATGELSNSIQEVFKRSRANPQELSIPKDEVIKVLEDGLSKSKVPSGEQAALFRRWIRALKDPEKFGDKLTADVVSEIETVFGKAAKFGKGVNNPALQQSAKEVNRYASGRMDMIAEKAGVPEFIKRSAEKSKLLKTASKKPGFGNKAIKKVLEGAFIGGGGALGYNVVKDLFD